MLENRTFLVTVVKGLACLGVCAAAIPFLAPFFSPTDSNRQWYQIDISGIEPGVPLVVTVGGNIPVIVLKPTDKQRQDLYDLTPHVWTDKFAGDLENRFYAYLALSSGRFGGCRLRHYARGESKMTRRNSSAQWLGGYWAQGCDASYDYAGRAHRHLDFGYSGYIEESTPLRLLEVKQRDAEQLYVRIM